MAGKSGLNLTRDQPRAAFAAAYTEGGDWLAPCLAAFGPAEVAAWARGLGVEVFTGSSGRVFPAPMKASPLLRAWLAAARGRRRRHPHPLALARLAGRRRPLRHARRPRGRSPPPPPCSPSAAAPGRASAPTAPGPRSLAAAGVPLAPFRPSNVGFRVAWSPAMARHFGAPVKPVRLTAGGRSVVAEFVVSAGGVEGGGIYALADLLRDGAAAHPRPPPRPRPAPRRRAPRPPARRRLALATTCARPSASRRSRSRCCANAPPTTLADPAAMARALKALPLPLAGPRPLDEAISTAGGVTREALDPDLMLRALPGVFCAGEMLDWDAPTGGYLLTACLATGRHAGRAAARRPGLPSRCAAAGTSWRSWSAVSCDR